MRCVNQIHRIAACVAGLALGASAAAGQNIISFSFTANGDNSANPQSGYLEASELAGAPGVRSANWNNLMQSADNLHPGAGLFDGTFGDTETVYYNDGTIVGGGFTFSGPIGFQDRSNGSFTNDREMFNGVRDAFGGNTTITLNNIPFAQYDLYAYMFDDGAQRVGTYTIGSLTYYVRGGVGVPDDTGAGYLLSTDITGGTVAADFDQGNYVRFSHLTASSVSLVVDAIDIGNLARNKIAGIQIVAVPEPGTAGLVGLGALAGVMAWRRRRN